MGGSNRDALLTAPDELFRAAGSIEVRPGSFFKKHERIKSYVNRLGGQDERLITG